MGVVWNTPPASRAVMKLWEVFRQILNWTVLANFGLLPNSAVFLIKVLNIYIVSKRRII
jgi:hypothetical protein